ncbi:MAG: alcohol dehydrogenase catalytic domain-containing protein, partial [Rhodospirillaceae bacterium]|nr:alcohol dehydrogenase catalytic domain-containing protein [Rhodospirillaceae bacterium]
MKGLVKYDHGPVNMEVRDMPVPEPDSGEVRVEIRAAGICGTDIHIYKDEYPYKPPVIMGHEFSGIVDEVADTEEYRPGDAVTGIPTTVVCGVCRYCVAGQHSLCDSRLSIGSGVHGVFTKYVV